MIVIGHRKELEWRSQLVSPVWTTVVMSTAANIFFLFFKDAGLSSGLFLSFGDTTAKDEKQIC